MLDVPTTRVAYVKVTPTISNWIQPIAIGSRSNPPRDVDRTDRDPIAIRSRSSCKCGQRCGWIAIGSRSDRDPVASVDRPFVLAHLTSLYQRFLQAKKPHIHIGHQSRDSEMRRRYRFQSAVWTLAIPIGSRSDRDRIAIGRIAIESRSDRDPFWSSVDRPIYVIVARETRAFLNCSLSRTTRYRDRYQNVSLGCRLLKKCSSLRSCR